MLIILQYIGGMGCFLKGINNKRTYVRLYKKEIYKLKLVDFYGGVGGIRTHVDLHPNRFRAWACWPCPDCSE